MSDRGRTSPAEESCLEQAGLLVAGAGGLWGSMGSCRPGGGLSREQSQLLTP